MVSYKNDKKWKQLPDRVLSLISEFSSTQDIISLNGVCEAFRANISQDIEIWRKLFTVDFVSFSQPPQDIINSDNVDYIRSCYFSACKQRRNQIKKQKTTKKHKKWGDEIKIVVLGTGGVGKSATVVQFIHNVFVTYFDPTIEDSYRKMINIGTAEKPNQVILDILDTAGPEEFPALREMYMKQSNLAIFVFDLSNKDSIADMEAMASLWNRLVEEDPDKHSVLVGNKSDLLETVTTTDLKGIRERAQKFQTDYKIPLYFEVSAKLVENIHEMFESSVKLYMYRIVSWDSVKEEVKQGKVYFNDINDNSFKKKCIVM
eukprot:gb/GECH01001851.1/.p1 GENE.gb/GECH01001851.1/~~gb/GECH01001851.1/.p1  ORF type:complete len:317 (+),score=74.31 gb/GECH01001851.1/:1-951(+)